MDPRLHTLALRKQSLQMRAAAQRANASWRLSGIEGALDRVDRLRSHFDGAPRLLPVLVLASLTVLATRPRLALRLGKRAWLGWLLVQRVRGGAAGRLLPLAAPLAEVLLKAAKAARRSGGRR